MKLAFQKPPDIVVMESVTQQNTVLIAMQTAHVILEKNAVQVEPVPFLVGIMCVKLMKHVLVVQKIAPVLVIVVTEPAKHKMGRIVTPAL